MAGEWIKVEFSTADKPEVMKIARILGIDRDAAFGKLIRFWAWIDVQSVDGVVDGVVDADVDDICYQKGFAKALEQVGWLVIDEEAESISLPNFDRHNGETAKQRALKNKRQSKWRHKNDNDVDASPSTEASTREEKNIKEEDSSSDDASRVWQEGLKLFIDAGVKEPSARSLLGKHFKKDKGRLADVLGQMIANPPIDPSAYLSRAMQSTSALDDLIARSL